MHRPFQKGSEKVWMQTDDLLFSGFFQKVLFTII